MELTSSTGWSAKSPTTLGTSPSLKCLNSSMTFRACPGDTCRRTPGTKLKAMKLAPEVGGDQCVVKLAKSAYLEARHVEIAA